MQAETKGRDPRRAVRGPVPAVLRAPAQGVGAEPMVIKLTEVERSRMIAGLAFFRSRRLGCRSSPWSQVRAAEAEIDAALDRFATQVGSAPR